MWGMHKVRSDSAYSVIVEILLVQENRAAKHLGVYHVQEDNCVCIVINAV